MNEAAVSAAAGANNSLGGYQALTGKLAGIRQEFNQGVLAGNQFELMHTKLTSAANQYGEALKRNDVGLFSAIKNRGLFNSVLKEQIGLQNSQSLSWTKNSAGQISSDLIIPKNLSADVATVTQRLGLMNTQLASVSSQTINWGKNTQWAGRQLMTGLTMPLTILAGATMKFAYDMDKAITMIVKVYGNRVAGLTETDAQIVAMAKQTIATATASFGASFEETTAIMQRFAAAGQTGVALMQMTLATVKFATAGQLDYNEAINAGNMLVTTYHLNSKGLGDSFAYINAIKNQTVLTAQDVVTALPKVVGIANAIKQPFSDTMTMLVAAKAAGVTASQAANAIKSIDFKVLTANSKSMKEFSDMTGQSLSDIIDKNKGQIMPILEDMGHAMANLTNLQKVELAKQVFGLFQGSKALAEINEIISNSMQMQHAHAVAAMTDGERLFIVNKEIALQQAQPFQMMTVAWQSIRNSLADIGGTILPIAAKFVGWIGSLVKSFGEMDGAKKTLIMVGLAMVGMAGPIIMIIGLFANLIGNVGRVISFMSNLVLRFQITDAAERATALQAQELTSVWNTQSHGVEALTQQYASLNSLLADNVGLQQEAAASAAGGKAVAFHNQAPQVFTPTTTLDRTVLPTGYGITGDNVLRNSQGVAVSEEQALAALNKENEAAVMQGNLFKTNYQLSQQRATEEAVILDRQTAQTAELAAQKESSLALSRTAGGGIMMAGVMGTMLGGSNALAQSLSNVAMMGGMVIMMFPKIGAAALAAFAQVGLYSKMIVANMAASPLLVSIGTGIKAMAAGFMAVLPEILVGVAAIALAWKLVHDAEANARAESEAYGRGIQDMAALQGVAWTTPQAKQKITQTAQETIQTFNDEAIKFSDKNPIAAGMMKNMFKTDPNSMQGEADRWNVALQDALVAGAHGASPAQMENIARTYMAVMNKTFTDAQWQIFMKVHIIPTTDAAETAAVLSKMNSDLAAAIKDVPSWSERTFGDYSTTNLSAWGKAQAEIVAKSMSEQLHTAGPAAGKLMIESMFAQTQAPLDDAFKKLMSNPATASRLKKDGLDSATAFAAGFATMPTGDKGILTNILGLSNDTVTQLTGASSAIDVMLVTLAKANSIKYVPGSGLAAFEKAAPAMFDLKNATITADQAWQEYTNELNFAAAAHIKLTDAQKLQILNGERLKAGLRETTVLADGMNVAITGSATGYNKASGAVMSYAAALLSIKVPAAITGDVVTTSYKAVITGTLDTVGSESTAALTKDATAAMDALKASDTAAIDAIDAKATAASDHAAVLTQQLQDKQTQATDALTAKHTLEQTALTDLWDARKKKVTDAYDAQTAALDKQIKTEQDQETQRQAIFAAEQTRITQLATMYGKNIDFNMAVNSGSLDTAAKIQNDMYSTQLGWQVGAGATTDAQASKAKVDALNVTKTNATTAKDAQIAAMDAVSKAQTVALNEQIKREDIALKASQKLATERLKASNDLIAKQFKAQKAAATASNTATEKQAQDEWTIREAGFARELATLRAYVPRNEKEMNNQIAAIQKLYTNYGGKLQVQGDKWGGMVALALKTQVGTQGNALRTIINWASVGSDISASITQGAFGMTPAAFAKWLGGKAPAPAGTLFGAPKTAAQILASQGGARQHAINMAINAAGGHIKGPGTGTSDSIASWLSNGEYVINARQTAKHLPLIEAINNGGVPRYASGGLIGMGSLPGIMATGEATAMIQAAIFGAAGTKLLADRLAAAEALAGAGAALSPDKAGHLYESMRAWISTRFPGVGGAGSPGAQWDYRPGTGNSYHAKGTAVDISPPNMAIVDAITKAFGKNIAELIYAPAGLKQLLNGNSFIYDPATEAGHVNHVHWAMHPGYTGGSLSGVSSGNAANKTYMDALATSKFGWGAELGSLDSLMMGESGFSNIAQNPGSTAYGIGQFLDSTWAGYGPKTSDAHLQALYTLEYIKNTYVDPNNAYAQWSARSPHWYHEGGPVGMPQLKTGGYTMNEGLANFHPKEMTLNAAMTEKLNRGVDQLATGPVNTYTIKADFSGAIFHEQVDVELALENVLKKAELRNGPVRRIGAPV